MMVYGEYAHRYLYMFVCKLFIFKCGSEIYQKSKIKPKKIKKIASIPHPHTNFRFDKNAHEYL